MVVPEGHIVRVTHLVALKFRSQVLPQAAIAFISSWSDSLSVSFFISLNILVSSGGRGQLGGH